MIRSFKEDLAAERWRRLVAIIVQNVIVIDERDEFVPTAIWIHPHPQREFIR